MKLNELEQRAEEALGSSISWALIGLTQEQAQTFTAKLSDAIGGEHYDEGDDALVDYFIGLYCESARTEAALREAEPHVYRQLQGRHEQDRIDAAAWLKKWGDKV